MNHRDLSVYKLSVQLAVEVYAKTKSFPKDEMFGLTSQMRRAAVSISCNIAEGSARNNPKELIQFLGIARGSCAELQALVEISEATGILNPNHVIQSYASDVAKMLTGLLRSVRTK